MHPSVLNQPLSHQFSVLLLLGLAVACVSWTITHEEEVFREPGDFCKEKSRNSKRFYQRKFFYLFTCEYCFSHYVTALFLLLTQFQMLYQGWRGFVISEFALVWIANISIWADSITCGSKSKLRIYPSPNGQGQRIEEVLFFPHRTRLRKIDLSVPPEMR